MSLALFPLSMLFDQYTRAKQIRKHFSHHHSPTPSKVHTP